MKNSPTQRTLEFLRAAGYLCAITEHWNPHARIRQDLFGFIDLIGLHPDEPGILAVQTTTGSHHADRVNKIIGLPAAQAWLENGNRIAVISWRKLKGHWEPRWEKITLANFVEEAVA